MMKTEWDGIGVSPWLYAKTATGAVNVWCCWTEGNTVCVRWGQEGGALQDARFKCMAKNVGRANATTAEEQAVSEALSKFKKQLKKKYFLTRDGAETKLNFKPMLAKNYKDRVRKLRFPVDVQPKYDGVRCLARQVNGRVTLMSRGGDPYNVPHVIAVLEGCLEDGDVLDGELYHHGTSLQTITSWVKRLQPGTANIVYCVYDTICMKLQDEPWEARRSALASWFAAHGSSVSGIVEEVATQQVFTPDQVRELHDEFVRQGYEGAIIRLHQGKYTFGHRSSDLLKLKDFQDGEFEIVGWTTGKGRFADVPIFRCVTAEGKTFDVTPKGSEQQRLEMLKNANSLIGQQLTVRYFDLTDDGVPHFPVGVAIRDAGV